MKVVILGSAHPLRGGLAAYNERLAREYQAQGCEVIIYTFSLQYPDFLFPGQTQYSSQSAPTDLDIRVKVNSVNPFNWIKIGREIKALNADLMVVKFWLPFMSPCLGTISRIVKSNKKTKIVSIIDNIIPHEKRIGDFWLAKYFVGSVHGFVVMSKAVLGELDLFDKEKPKVFSPHPLYDNFGEKVRKADAIKKLGLEINGQYILFFGFIRDYKGLDILLEALSDKRFSDSYLELIVAGEFYSDPKPYHDLIKKLGLEKRVILRTDFIADDMVRYYFCAADLVVQPYKHATQSGVTQICYHFNRPMIVTNVGGLPEMVPHEKVGYVAEPNADSIAFYIDQFFKEHREYPFRDNIIKEKEKYSWEKMLAAIQSIAKIPKKRGRKPKKEE